MPSGKPIDWSLYDDLLQQHLPAITIEEWCRTFAPHISSKAIGARAKKLCIKPGKYKASDEHKAKISNGVISHFGIETPELVETIRKIRDTHSRRQICAELSIDDTTLDRIIKRNNIVLSEAGVERAKESSRTASLGKVPWNKGGELSEETKAKISAATSGENNSQYGRGMTEEEKEKWRKAFFSNGIHKIREWLQSDDGKTHLKKTTAATQTPEFRRAQSERMAQAILDGRLYNNTRGHGSHLVTVKGGSFYTKSTYETRYVAILEADDNVKSFVYEPLRIPYEFGGQQLYYIPDFLVEYCDGHEELVEVKPAKLVDLPKNRAKISAGKQFEIDFVVVTEDELNKHINNG